MGIEEKYINPFTDFGFKKLFGTEFNKELLLDFLNQVLAGREQIQQLTYLNNENSGRTAVDRIAVFDIYCENERGEKFIIELQNVRQEYFKDRSIYYATFPIQSQSVKGKKWDYSLKAVYTIGILNFTFPDKPEQERYLREIQLLDKETHEVFYDKLTLIYLEIPKFRKQEEELETQFDKWMYVLRNLHKLQERPRKLQEKVFEKLFKEAEIAKLKPEDMKTYEASLKAYRDNYSALESAKKVARAEGRAEGIAEGKAEGQAQGKAEGERNKARAIAKELKLAGIPVSVIEKATGLSAKQIAKL